MFFCKKGSFSKYFLFVVLIFTIVSASFTSGCIPFFSKGKKDHARELAEDALMKKVWIASFKNMAPFMKGKLEATFHQNFMETIISSSPGIIIVKPGDTAFSDSSAEIPRLPSGEIDNYVLAIMGRRFGINSVVTGTLKGIEGETKKKGVWGFRKIQRFAKLKIQVNAYDTETGAMMYEETFEHAFDVNESEYNIINSNSVINMPELDTFVAKVAGVAGEKLSEVINKQPWKGFASSVTDERVIITSGKEVGLKPGDTFDVYNSNKEIKGIGNLKYFIPGVKTGQIKLVSVFSNMSEAVPVSGTVIEAGYSIKQPVED